MKQIRSTIERRLNSLIDKTIALLSKVECKAFKSSTEKELLIEQCSSYDNKGMNNLILVLINCEPYSGKHKEK